MNELYKKILREKRRSMHCPIQSLKFWIGDRITWNRDCKHNFKWHLHATKSISRITTLPLKPLSDQIWIRYSCFSSFKLFNFICGFSAKGLAHFLLVRNNGDSIRINHLLIQKNNFIFHIFDQIKGTVKKNERGYRMKPKNLRRWMIHIRHLSDVPVSGN